MMGISLGTLHKPEYAGHGENVETNILGIREVDNFKR